MVVILKHIRRRKSLSVRFFDNKIYCSQTLIRASAPFNEPKSNCDSVKRKAFRNQRFESTTEGVAPYTHTFQYELIFT